METRKTLGIILMALAGMVSVANIVMLLIVRNATANH